MAGDIAGNAFYYALAGLGKGKNVLLNGLLLGLGAGAGAVLLPKHMDLNEAYSNRTPKTKLMTMGLYACNKVILLHMIQLLSMNKTSTNNNDTTIILNFLITQLTVLRKLIINEINKNTYNNDYELIKYNSNDKLLKLFDLMYFKTSYNS